jgi:hypothetical protein
VRALLISSGLPRFLWEEAMKHVEWLKARSPHCALDGKTPYEMKHKKKLHLGGIHKFGAAAYVNDLKAGKLDLRAQLGWFIGYNSESKGFRIYWPNKQSVTVERNVVFNDSDVMTDATALIQPQTPKSKTLYLSHLHQKHLIPCHVILLKNRILNRL